jgi:DNA processing protein
MPISPDMIDRLALALVPGLGPKLTAALVERFGSAAAIRSATEEQLRQVQHIGEKLSRQFADALRSLDLEAEIEQIEKYNVHLLGLEDPQYPAALAKIETAPPLLYCRGTLTDADSQAVAIVGSRNCTAYGRKMAERIAGGLVRAGYTVVSGLARGIDGAAHQGALNAGGRTIAVLAGGLSRIYPPEHVALSVNVENSGCLITETPMTFEPLPGMFPARNRIISGLSRAVIIIEAGDKSGALITARHAAEQGREVFAVPANADSLTSAGSLRLIRDGARLVRDADDILEDLAGISPLFPPSSPEAIVADATEPPTVSPPPGLDDTQRKIWESLADGPRPIDDLVQATGTGVAQLNGILMMLEMKKVVRRLPGNMYERR